MTEDRLEVGQSSRFGTDGLVKEVLVKHLQVELILFISFIEWRFMTSKKQFGNQPSLSFDNPSPSSCAIQQAQRWDPRNDWSVILHQRGCATLCLLQFLCCNVVIQPNMCMCLLCGTYRVLLVYFALPIAANPWSPISSVFWPVSSVFIGTKSCSLVKTFYMPLLVAGSSRWQTRTTTSLFWAILLAYWKSGYLPTNICRPITEQYHFWGVLGAWPMRMLHQRNRNGLDYWSRNGNNPVKGQKH